MKAREAVGAKHVRRELLENQSLELLQTLHLVTRDGQLNADARRKLKQVNHFVGLLQPALDDAFARFPQPVVVDVGSGNAYLGFILYELFMKGAGELVNVESRPELSDRATERATALKFERMRFRTASIEGAEYPAHIHVMTALHACDTATDDALAVAIAHRAEHVALVPCCQAEVAAQLKDARPKVDSAMQALFSHPWHRREFGSHLTNVIRALVLEAHGYQVTVTELAGWEHSLKNELILGRRVQHENKIAKTRLEALLAATGVRPKIVRTLGLAVTHETVFVGTTPGLEGPLAEELESLGFPGEPSSGGVTVQAPAGSYRTINLWSRLASRVLLRVAEVASVDALRRLPLSQFSTAFEVDAFGEAAASWGGALPSTPAAVKLLLRGTKGRCQVSVDTSGELLHFRGYRQEVGRAPMRETLAAGLLRMAKWSPGEPLWDVMCGSGTILIEAAELAAGLAPGRNRRFAFESFASHDEQAWKALPRASAEVKTMLVGSDLNAGALGTARRNAKRAGVFELLELERVDATKLVSRGPSGLVVANLPYGKRVGERDELGQLYRALGASLKTACPGWYFAFLLESGAEHLGLTIAERHRVSNGGLECEVVLGQVPN